MAVGIGCTAAEVVVVVLVACAGLSFSFFEPGDALFSEFELAVEGGPKRLVEAELPVEVVGMALPVLAILETTRSAFEAMSPRLGAPEAVVWSARAGQKLG